MVSQKVRKATFYESVLYLVFSVLEFNSLVYRHIFHAKYKILNTKYLMNSTFYEFINFKRASYG